MWGQGLGHYLVNGHYTDSVSLVSGHNINFGVAAHETYSYYICVHRVYIPTRCWSPRNDISMAYHHNIDVCFILHMKLSVNS